jgi:integrase
VASIEKRGENTYRLVVEVGYDASGKRMKRYKAIKIEEKLTPKKLKEYLNEELLKFKIEVESGEYISPEKMTFSAFVDVWLSKYAMKEYAPKTMALTEHLLDNFIRPRFANFKLSEIKTMHIVMFLDDMEKPGVRKDGKNAPFSASTRTSMHRILRVIFKTAMAWNIINKHPMEGLKYPKPERKRAAYYDEDESTKLLELLQFVPLNWRTLIVLAITTGIRRGEICALEWKHVKFDEGIIDIEQAMIYTKATKKQISDTKNIGSDRRVAMPEITSSLLKTLRAESVKDRVKMGNKWKGGDAQFVFTSMYGESYTPEYISTWWKDFTIEKNLKLIKFHGLRHTSASLLINKGVHAKVISDRLGHSNINITMNTYGHVFRKADEGAAKTFDDIFNPSPVRPQNKNKRGKNVVKSSI